ncbi:MAG: hypothetical protein ACRBM6_06745 [Geminicoccales bacterium]
MGQFYMYVGEVLGTVADILQPRTIDELLTYSFDENEGQTATA